MEFIEFITILNDNAWNNYQKLSTKYPKNFNGYLELLRNVYYCQIPIKDRYGANVIYQKDRTHITDKVLRKYLEYPNNNFSASILEEEIISTSAIENIDFKRDSVRKILQGSHPSDEAEKRIEGLKKGIEFIADRQNTITEDTIYRLYMMTIGNYLQETDRPKTGSYYRDDVVYIVGSSSIEHTGIDSRYVSSYMKELVNFINRSEEIDALVKACIIHFYIGYVHPWFDGNGRMARLLHMWYLIQQGYHATLFLPFSSFIEKNRKAYYRAFELVERNSHYSKVIDVSPFIDMINTVVYTPIASLKQNKVIPTFNEFLHQGKITSKEASLFRYALSHFGTNEFSTKDLEKAYGDAAYATIRSFVQKFSQLELLEVIHYTTKSKYRIKL